MREYLIGDSHRFVFLPNAACQAAGKDNPDDLYKRNAATNRTDNRRVVDECFAQALQARSLVHVERIHRARAVVLRVRTARVRQGIVMRDIVPVGRSIHPAALHLETKDAVN